MEQQNEAYQILNQVEKTLNDIVGVVTNGLFAMRPADVLLLGSPEGTKTVFAKSKKAKHGLILLSRISFLSHHYWRHYVQTAQSLYRHALYTRQTS